ncbi:phosphoadenosine phosphosulfate reductase family protein [Clostridium aceticum]|uniref:Phosphoadenosine phosphosulfate reductase family protein n=1 Tax=Clostridium aceticum TaxID=84022 RepID=A0A0D8I994_9CLOT|nr:phosphoadenosine phosphosulfate reductase family protein [Clostridium aceticum]AKL95591.1 phosphoadenosine phosphosulfate reductase family protein [Clostridium aceticum]KJF26835.1 phosphoadenosine phosphosulfate reductase [Clostridium aceticum]
MWCDKCKKRVNEEKCPDCSAETQFDIPTEIYWCRDCKVPIIKEIDSINREECPLCRSEISYLSQDLKPVFPEERLLLESLKGTPLKYKDNSVWSIANCYFIDGEKESISSKKMKEADGIRLLKVIEKHKKANNSTYSEFIKFADTFVRANKERLHYLKEEAHSFIHEARKNYNDDQIIVSFSGGKDSTVVSDLVIKALSNPEVVHIFGDTTLEFPLTLEYVKRFKTENPLTIIRDAKNKEQDFYEVCNEIGPPSRVMRWCCTMFKTGPINRRINAMFKEQFILTFYGIRKFESVSRSKYDRIYDSPKIKKQKVASPIFYWKDIDIWLYILAEKIDFNDAYRLGYDRVGCWCCPNNSARSHFLARIYMAEEVQKWRNYLVDFARKIGKPDAENYVDSGNWKARQGGYGIKAADDVKIVSKNCTTEENAKIYQLKAQVTDEFFNLFVPFGKVSKEMGSKLLNEVLVLDVKTNIPIISIQTKSDKYDFSVKIKTLNVKKHDDLQRMIGYQVRKYNACRKCLSCETVCMFNAITVSNNGYKIDENKCTKCKMCVTSKHLEYGCLMGKYLYSSATKKGDA